MMAHKAWLFGDHKVAEEILAASHPGEAKALGRQVHGFDENVWCEHRFDIVLRGSIAKFASAADMRKFLLGTRNRVLVEASPLDRVWGIGLAATDERATSPTTWKGLNLLGFALMEAREFLAHTGRSAAFRDHQEVTVRVVGVASVGVEVDVDGRTGFIDQVKHPSWWDPKVVTPQAGDEFDAVVLDADRRPPRLSALQQDIDNARRLRNADAG
jgi:ribA/ribD-fused uncharacterized protein